MVSLGEQEGGVAQVVARILFERKQATKWTVRSIAEELGWAMGTVQRYLHGERVLPIDGFYRLSRLLGVDPKEVLLRAEQELWRQQAAHAGLPTVDH